MPRIQYISTHIGNFCPVQIKDNFIINTKSAYRANMLMCMFNGGRLALILPALGGLHFIFWRCGPGNDHY